MVFAPLSLLQKNIEISKYLIMLDDTSSFARLQWKVNLCPFYFLKNLDQLV